MVTVYPVTVLEAVPRLVRGNSHGAATTPERQRLRNESSAKQTELLDCVVLVFQLRCRLPGPNPTVRPVGVADVTAVGQCDLREVRSQLT